MYKKNLSNGIIFVLFIIKFSYHAVSASNLFLEDDENTLVIDTDSEDNNIIYFEQNYPLDLTMKNKPLKNENNVTEQIYSNNSIRKVPLVSVKSPIFINPQDLFSSDSLNNTNIIEMNKKISNGVPFFISYRYLKFFLTKKKFYDLLVVDLGFSSHQSSIMNPNRSLITTKYMLLNVKNDIIEVIADLGCKNQIGPFNLSLLKSFYDIDNFLSCLISSMRMSPAFVKADSRVFLILEDFVQNLYGRCNRYILCLSANKLSKYININFKLFSLGELLDTLIIVSFGCPHMKSDLKSIIFSILFFYNHKVRTKICTMEFILKDMMIRIISYIILYKQIEADNTKTDHRKQFFYNKIENEIKKSFLLAFYSKDLTLIMSNLELMRVDIYKSKIEVIFDFSFVVILSKTFESMHHLKSILYDIKDDEFMLLKDELRQSCKKLFEFKESIFD